MWFLGHGFELLKSTLFCGHMELDMVASIKLPKFNRFYSLHSLLTFRPPCQR